MSTETDNKKKTLTDSLTTFRKEVTDDSINPERVAGIIDRVVEYAESSVGDVNESLRNKIDYPDLRDVHWISSSSKCTISNILVNPITGSSKEVRYDVDPATPANAGVMTPEHLVALSGVKAALEDSALLHTLARLFGPLCDRINADYNKFAVPGHRSAKTYMLANGLHTEEAPDKNKPFFYYGEWFSASEVVCAALDPWTKTSYGEQSNSAFNFPLKYASFEPQVDLSWAATNNAAAKVLVLGTSGFYSEVLISRAYRAFDGARNLKSIVGIMDMRNIKSQWDVNNLFRNCQNLEFFWMRNIPDTVLYLDLSGCDLCGEDPESGIPKLVQYVVANPDAENGLYYTTAIGRLVMDLARDIERKKRLLVVVSADTLTAINHERIDTMNSKIVFTDDDSEIQDWEG